MILLDLAQQANLNPKWTASTQGGEYKSLCPSCGGTDRFIIQPNKQQKNCTGFFFCRRCEISGDTIQFAIDHLGYTFSDATKLIGVTIENTIRHSLFKTPYKPSSAPLMKRSPIWQEQAAKYLEQAHSDLLLNQDVLTYLAKRGLPLDAVINYRLGWSAQDQCFARIDWNLPEESKEDGTLKKLWLPRGLIIPTIDFGKIIRLKTRRTNWNEGDALPKYIAIPGSSEGLNIIGNKKHPVLIVAETELDGYALHHAVGDFSVIIAIGGSIKKPDDVTDYLAQHKVLLICPDSDSAGNDVWKKWSALYPHAINCQTTTGKDIGEAIEQGLDLRSWIISKLPEQLQYDLRLIKYPWSEQDQPLIDWALDFINTKTSCPNAYKQIREEIELGPKSQQAQTKELQNKLQLMQELAQQQYENKG